MKYLIYLLLTTSFIFIGGCNQTLDVVKPERELLHTLDKTNNGYDISSGGLDDELSIDFDYTKVHQIDRGVLKNELSKSLEGIDRFTVEINNIDNGNLEILDYIVSINKDVKYYDFYFKFSEYRDEYYTFMKPLYNVNSIASFDIHFGKLNDVTLTKTISEYVTLNKHHASRDKHINYLVFGSYHDDFGDYNISISDIEKLYKLYSIGFGTSIPGWDDVSYESRLEFLKNTPIQEYGDKRFHKWGDTIRESNSDRVHELGEEHVGKYWPTRE